MKLVDEVRWVAEDSRLFADVDTPFRAAVTKKAPRLVLIVGENASGKSLFLKVLAARVRNAGVRPIQVSIRKPREESD